MSCDKKSRQNQKEVTFPLLSCDIQCTSYFVIDLTSQTILEKEISKYLSEWFTWAV